jgi:haloacetate dehalogenase
MCPTFALWGSAGVMHRLVDMESAWRKRRADLRIATLPGGYFFIDQLPKQTARVLLDVLGQ